MVSKVPSCPSACVNPQAPPRLGPCNALETREVSVSPFHSEQTGALVGSSTCPGHAVCSRGRNSPDLPNLHPYSEAIPPSFPVICRNTERHQLGKWQWGRPLVYTAEGRCLFIAFCSRLIGANSFLWRKVLAQKFFIWLSKW